MEQFSLDQNEKHLKTKETDRFLVWNKKRPNSQLEKFQQVVEEKYNINIESYWDLHKWSVNNFSKFWEEVWHHLDIISSKPYIQAFRKTGSGFLDNEWFSGATFNYAENVLRKRDNKEAIIYLDEEGICEKLTFLELFEEVKLFAAALRKNGLKKGDRVACYMSNRKEAIIAMLATASIGAIWGGPQPYLGTRAASEIISRLEPKFLITEDRHLDSGMEYNFLEALPHIAKSSPSLEKIIILVTKEQTLSKDLSNIPNKVFLKEFLQDGLTSDGLVPDIIFEQLPFNHPIFILFTSGTTSMPKGIVHCGGSLLGPMMYYSLHCDLKSGDTIYSKFPNGWIPWNVYATLLGLGIRLVLHSGNPFRKDDYNIWDVIIDFDVSFVYLVAGTVDKMEKMNLQPKRISNFEHLKTITIGSAPVKIQNCAYLKSIVKDNVYISSAYGTTEAFAFFSGCDFNQPVYAPEMQVPALGFDVQCFNENGHSIIGETGQLVIATPNPCLLDGLWKDNNNTFLQKSYFGTFKDVWNAGDACWFNPDTKGFLVKGRSDDVLIQYGERFSALDVYMAIHDMEEIQDYICVGQTKANGDCRAILFVKMKPGFIFSPEVKDKIAEKIRSDMWALCVPELILETKDVPYNVNNKRLETLVRRIVATNTIPDTYSARNPECFKYFCNIPEILSCSLLQEN